MKDDLKKKIKIGSLSENWIKFNFDIAVEENSRKQFM